MEINIDRKDTNLTIYVEGRVDTVTSRELEAVVNREIGNCSYLIFDFDNLEYISSAGLRILLGAQKLMGNQGMKVINVSEAVNEIFEITGFALILDIEKKP